MNILSSSARSARVVMVALAAVAASTVLLGSQAQAQPSGSYQNSCTNITDDGAGSPTVYASCKRKNGSYKNTSLAYHICQGDIWNNDGTLQCTPRGSFKNSCNSISWNASYLTAKCRKKNGSYIWNSGFNYNTCVNNGQDIANCDGSLKCGGC